LPSEREVLAPAASGDGWERREDRQGRPEPFSFAAFPRTRSLVNTLSVRYYGSKTEVVRACIAVLSNIKALDLLADEPREAS
jgi:hypothetical protein